MFSSRNNRVHVTSRRRLRDKDYSEPGYYFLTICINDRSHRLGEIVADRFQPTPAGAMVEAVWHRAPEMAGSLHLDAYCVMPDHFHGIIGLGTGDHDEGPHPSIISVMNWFKSTTTVEYIRGVKEHGWPQYARHLWLEGYHDRVIRNELELERIREYIQSNPANWQKDGFYAD